MQFSSIPRTPSLSISCTTHIIQDGFIATIYVLLPILAQAFGFTYAQVGLLKGLKSAAQAALELGSGWLCEKTGEYRVIATGLVLSGAGYALLSIAPGVGMITASLIIIGMGTALHHAPASALIVNSYSVNGRSGPLGIYNASGDIGKLVFTGGVSLAFGAGLAWYQISLLYGLVGLLAAVGIAVATWPAQTQAHQDATVESALANPSSGQGWGILNWPAFGSLLVATSIDTMVQTSTLVFVAFLMLANGLPLFIATAATVILLAGGVFGKAGCGFLSQRIGARRAFVLIQTLTALGLIAVVLLPNWWALGLLFPLGMVAQGSTSITYGFAAVLIHPRRMARGYALLYSSGTFAAAVGPFAFGLVADSSGIEMAICAMAAFAILAVPPIFLLPSALEPVD